PSTHTSDGPSKRGHHDPLYNLLRKDPPTLQSANNQEFQQWILEVERMFLLHGADEDSHRRSVWASGGIKRGVTAVIQAVNTRLEAYSASATLPAIREPLYWAELIQIIQDAIKNPAVRRGEQAVLYWNATMRPSQTVATFFNYMKNMEKSFDVPMVDGYHRINFYYTKLPERIRDRLIEGNVLKDITSTDELMDHALRHEQTSTRTPIAARQAVGKLNALIANMSTLQLGRETRGKEKRLVLSIRTETTTGPIVLRALVDNGAQINLISQRLVKLHDLPIDEEAAKKPTAARFLDDNKMALYKPHTLHVTTDDYSGEARTTQQLFWAASFEAYDMVLGWDWLVATNPMISWRDGSFVWSPSPGCRVDHDKIAALVAAIEDGDVDYRLAEGVYI
ncbi:hypothetical protein LTR56_028172, partial [Elasticomyces elasticus]